MTSRLKSAGFAQCGQGPLLAALFLACWFTLGLLIRGGDLELYNLQLAGAYSVALTGDVAVTPHGVPEFEVVGDAFEFKGVQRPAKQPGQFYITGAACWVLEKLGLRFGDTYLLTAALATWCSAGLLAVVLVFAVRSTAQLLGANEAGSWLAGFSALFATPLLPYSGVAHHDLMASVPVVLCFRALIRPGGAASGLAGFYAGMTLFISMLPAPALLAMLSISALRECPRFYKHLRMGLGLLVGLLPLLAYNTHAFGAPWINANVAGDFNDTFWRFDPAILLMNCETYFGNGGAAIWKYTPVCAAGLVWALVRCRRDLATTLITCAGVAQTLYLIGLDTIGHCIFGPRYFMQMFPLWTLWVAFIPGKTTQPDGKWLFAKQGVSATLLAASLAINVAGAMIGTMNCDLRYWVPGDVFTERRESVFPLFSNSWLGVTLLFWGMACYFIARRLERARNPTTGI